jgi:uncharacterized protein YjbI with pentapeptide repeats
MKTFLFPLALVASLTASTSTIAASKAGHPNMSTQTEGAGLHANGVSFNGRTFNGVSFNGFSFNGKNLNGVWLNGTKFNGINLNGFTLNGFTLNGIKWNGLTLNGKLFNGWSLNGTSLQGRSFISFFDDSDNVTTDANWSSIALENVHVRLPLARWSSWPAFVSQRYWQCFFRWHQWRLRSSRACRSKARRSCCIRTTGVHCAAPI